MFFFFFFFNDTATTEIYTLSLHDALPILVARRLLQEAAVLGATFDGAKQRPVERRPEHGRDRKSTRLNSSHLVISYAVFCLKKKKAKNEDLLTSAKQWLAAACQIAVTERP